MTIFYKDKSDTKQDQHHCNRNRIVKIFFKDIVEQQADYCRRNAGNNDLEPHFHDVLFHNAVCFGSSGKIKRPDLFPEQQHNR